MGGRGGGGENLDVGSVSLQSFKSRIDEILIGLDASAATPHKLGEQAVSTTAFGTGFAAAEELASHYEKIRTRLETLSRTFCEQIEAMGLAVDMADKDYQGIDAEQAARLRAIMARTEKHYQSPTGAGANTPEIGSGETVDGGAFS
ncbi:hypothetical protein [Streptomyces sp. TP-A0874]|uniref:hypothetical protein n=1 Tax=Streptomyces sp. TP-A0874 TaxID=549819 RepID=UPI000852D30C|nr:hypothetical protein [Streptomyces sp. TP-A0874]